MTLFERKCNRNPSVPLCFLCIIPHSIFNGTGDAHGNGVAKGMNEINVAEVGELNAKGESSFLFHCI